MYLSRLILNHSSSQVRRDLASRYELHRTLHRAVADSPGRSLWRLVMRPDGPTEILMQSPDIPDFSALVARPEYSDYLLSSETKPWLPAQFLKAGNCYRFFLEANPTTSAEGSRSTTRRGKRVGVSGTENQYRWLVKQGEKSGFELLGCLVRDSEVHRVPRNGKPMTILGVNYEGHLKVQDVDAFFSMVQSGLGHARGFGFGLLTLGK